MKKYTCLITTSVGLAPTLHRELKYLGVKPYNQFETGVFVDCTLKEIAFLNVWIRTGSKIRKQLSHKKQCDSFESLFTLLETLPRENYLDETSPFQIKAYSYNSDLESIPTIQSVSHKAILNRIIGKNQQHTVNNDKQAHTIRIQLHNNALFVYINTSGNALHERGRRMHHLQAPLKEHIAAALVLMTSRGYSLPLVDVCCGGGTIPIEAALIATNRAPGMHRGFACESFGGFNFQDDIASIKHDAQQKIFEKEYKIVGYDIDQEAIRCAADHASNAGVAHCISLQSRDCTDVILEENDTLITNPPYGKRIGSENVDQIHDIIFHKARYCKAATIISGYEHTHGLYHPRYRKTKQTKNGADRCNIYMHNKVN